MLLNGLMLTLLLFRLSTLSTNRSPTTPEENISHFIPQLVANFVRLFFLMLVCKTD